MAGCADINEDDGHIIKQNNMIKCEEETEIFNPDHVINSDNLENNITEENTYSMVSIEQIKCEETDDLVNQSKTIFNADTLQYEETTENNSISIFFPDDIKKDARSDDSQCLDNVTRDSHSDNDIILENSKDTYTGDNSGDNSDPLSLDELRMIAEMKRKYYTDNINIAVEALLTEEDSLQLENNLKLQPLFYGKKILKYFEDDREQISREELDSLCCSASTYLNNKKYDVNITSMLRKRPKVSSKDQSSGKSKTPGEKVRMSLREKIVQLSRAGKTTTEISKELGCALPTVRRWINRYKEEGDLSTMPKRGLPKKTTDAEDELIRETRRKHPDYTAVKIHRILGLNHLSIQTIINRLNEKEIDHEIPAETEELSPLNIEDRLRFCQFHEHHNFDYWQKIIFLDEKTFKSDKSGKVHCSRLNGKDVSTENPDCVTINMVGWMWAYGVGELTRIEDIFTGEQYVDMLQKVFLPTVRAMAIPKPGTIYLAQDNSSIHMCKLASKWFERHPEIIRMVWPSRSPDLNPMENIWDVILNKWEEANDQNPDDFERHAFAVWEGIRRNPTCCTNLIQSMHKRILDCLQANGGYTKY